MKYKTCRRHYKSLKKYRDFRILIWLGIGCFIAFGLFLLLTNVIFCKPNEFGDSAGATNGLFSALAFAGVIYAIFLQKDELSLQRQELKNTRKEIAGQKREFQMQNKTLKHQRFENTFFKCSICIKRSFEDCRTRSRRNAEKWIVKASKRYIMSNVLLMAAKSFILRLRKLLLIMKQHH